MHIPTPTHTDGVLVHMHMRSLSIKLGHSKLRNLSNENSVCCANHIELCTNLCHYIWDASLYIKDSHLSPDGVLYRDVPLHNTHIHNTCMHAHMHTHAFI